METALQLSLPRFRTTHVISMEKIFQLWNGLKYLAFLLVEEVVLTMHFVRIFFNKYGEAEVT